MSPGKSSGRDGGEVQRHDGSPIRPLIGWREWVALPELSVSQIKCKVDTGARSSSLHAFDIRIEEHDQESWVEFIVHPLQKRSTPEVRARAKLVDVRAVRSSSGHVEMRPTIETLVSVGDRAWPIHLTLTNRDEMGFRMLLGRSALKRRFWVDPHRSFIHGAEKHPLPRENPPHGS